jgi:hypothetical protein
MTGGTCEEAMAVSTGVVDGEESSELHRGVRSLYWLSLHDIRFAQKNVAVGRFLPWKGSFLVDDTSFAGVDSWRSRDTENLSTTLGSHSSHLVLCLEISNIMGENTEKMRNEDGNDVEMYRENAFVGRDGDGELGGIISLVNMFHYFSIVMPKPSKAATLGGRQLWFEYRVGGSLPERPESSPTLSI